VNIQHILQDWLGTVKLPSSVRMQIDIDPYSFL
jgi:primosomal protein N' (replication factor Y)